MDKMKTGSTQHSVDEFVRQYGLDNYVLDLLQAIACDNEKIKDLLISDYLGNPLSAVEEEELLDYFIMNSIFSAATVANPATSVVTELLYSQSKHPFAIDQYFLESKSGKAIRSRLLRVEEYIHELIEDYRKDGDVLIGNLGGGPGRDVCDVFSSYYQDSSNVVAITVERDEMAIKRGTRIAEAAGVDDKVHFSRTSFMRFGPEKKFNIILLVGVLCSLPPETCVAVLKVASQMMADGGCIMVSNVTPLMVQEDPFTYFIMEKIVGWKLIFKTDGVMKDILNRAGLTWTNSFTDDYGFHLMAIGTK